MGRFIYFAAILANIALFIAALYLALSAYDNREVLFALLLALPPFLAIAAIYSGPDLEERRLRRQLTKYQLKQELKQIRKSAKDSAQG